MRVFVGSFARLDRYGALKRRCSALDAVWVDEKMLHLTYAFFPDEVDPDRIAGALDTLPLLHQEVAVGGLALFGRELLYAVCDDEALYANADLIRKELGPSPESFEPHITLARIRSCDEKRLRSLAALPGIYSQGKLEAQIHLILSRPGGGGPRYEILKSYG